MIKRFLFISVLLLLAAAAVISGDDKKPEPASLGQPAIESYDITPDPVGRGDIFTMTIVIDHETSADVDFPLKELPEQLQRWRGPYIRSFIDTDRDGNPVRKVRITTTFKARESGRMIVPPLTVIVDKKRLETKPELLRVGLYKDRKLYMPLEVEWQSGFEDIYAGEAVPLYLMVKKQESVILFDRTRVAYPRDGFFEKARGVGDIVTMSDGDIVLYDIPAASFIYTVPVSGEVKIPSAGVDYDGITGWTDNLFLDVKRLPGELDSGAVGSFIFTSSVDRSSVDAGGDIILSCTVEGDGNLNYLEMPVPEVEGCLLVSNTEIDDYTQSIYGYSGRRTAEWVYNAENSGTAKIIVPEFDYLDKKSGIIMTDAAQTYTVTVNENTAEPEFEEAAVFPYEKMPAEKSTEPVWRNNYRTAFMYVWLLPALIFYIILLIMKGRRLPVCAVITLIIMVSVFSAGRFLFDPDEADDSLSSVAYYNDSVDNYHEGNITDSLHNLRTAIYLDPVNTEYRQMLDWLEREYDYINSVGPAVRMHPDIFFYILAAAFNCFFIALSLKRFRSGGWVTVLVILFGFIVLFSGFMLFYSDNARKNLTGIMCECDAVMKKIPKDSADPWLAMRAGTAVRVLDESEGYLLIETGLGVKGWTEEKYVIPDRPDKKGED